VVGVRAVAAICVLLTGCFYIDPIFPRPHYHIVAPDVVFRGGPVTLTAQLDTELPRSAILKDIPIGTVEQIQVDGHNLLADVRPFVDPDRVNYAWVLLSQDE